MHIQKVHSAEPKERKRNFQCDICLGWYGSKGNLKSHKIIHTTQPQECDQCGNIYPNQTALEQHIRVVHSDLNFKCHLCDKSLRSQGALRVFYFLIHSFIIFVKSDINFSICRTILQRIRIKRVTSAPIAMNPLIADQICTNIRNKCMKKSGWLIKPNKKRPK